MKINLKFFDKSTLKTIIIGIVTYLILLIFVDPVKIYIPYID